MSGPIVSSHLLIQEPPLQVLPSLAERIGLNEAIVLQQLHYWIQRSDHVHDGYRWVYNTYEQWQENFPFWSIPTIKRTISKLESMDIVLSTDKYNNHKIDRTKWYTIQYSSPMIRPPYQNDPSNVSKRSAPPYQNDPLYIETETTPETTAETISGGEHQTIEFEVFWSHYPRKEGKADARKAWMKLNPDDSLCQTIGVALVRQIHNNWNGRAKQYIPLPASWLRGERWEDEVIQPQGPKVELIDRHGNFTVAGAAAHARGEI